MRMALPSVAVPSVAVQLVNLLCGIVDRIHIGHIPQLGTDALAGVGLTNALIILVASFAQLVGGGAPLVSIALGRGDRERAQHLLGNGLVLLLGFSVVCAGVCALVMRPVLMLMRPRPTTWALPLTTCASTFWERRL